MHARPGFETRVKRASQLKSQTAVSTAEGYFPLSVVCLIVEYAMRQHKGNLKNIQIVVGPLGWKWIERPVRQLILLIQKEVELLLYLVRNHSGTGNLEVSKESVTDIRKILNGSEHIKLTYDEYIYLALQ